MRRFVRNLHYLRTKSGGWITTPPANEYTTMKTDDKKPHLRFVPFRSLADKGWSDAWQIYTASFPHNEQWREADYGRAFGDPAFTAAGVWTPEQLIGILFYWKGEGFHYVEHLAVSPALRGQNVGSAMLKEFCARVGEVILEIDPPVDEISIRRLHFYERLGFRENPYEYIHPSFNRPFHPHKLVLMSYPDALTDEKARLFADFVREVVLRYSEHERPELPRLP